MSNVSSVKKLWDCFKRNEPVSMSEGNQQLAGFIFNHFRAISELADLALLSIDCDDPNNRVEVELFKRIGAVAKKWV